MIRTLITLRAVVFGIFVSPVYSGVGSGIHYRDLPFTQMPTPLI